MKQLSYTRLLAIVCFILAIGVMASCKKNDSSTNDGKAQLITFGPAGARPGDTIKFMGVNLNKVTAIQFTGVNASVDQSAFVSQSSDQILLKVPATAQRGYVTLKTPDGDIVTKTMYDLNIKSGATVTTITKNARPGDNITITGDYLNFVKRVTFNSNKQVINFVTQTKNQLVVTVPADAQTGPLVITFAGTDTSDVRTSDTLRVTLPIATSFAPTSVKHGTNLTITGTDLDLAKKVYLPGVSKPITSFVSQSATQLVVKVDSATTNGKVTLEAASGVQTTSSASITVTMPTVTNMSPNPVAEGSNVIITGTNLDVVKSVKFTGVTTAVSTFVNQSSTQIEVTVPQGAKIGPVTLNILNSSLTYNSPVNLYIVGQSVPPIIIYDDAVTNAWTSTGGWVGNGWGGTKDAAATAQVKSGTKSVQIDYTSGGYGVPFQLGGANISLLGYTNLKVSIYGGTGSNGKNVNIGFNETDGKTVTLVEGQWNDFTIPLSQISSATTLTHLYVKNYSSSGAFTIYVDDLGIY